MDFALPQLGEGIYEAELVRWLVRPGENVKHSQSLMEVLTDKATMEVPSPFVGTVTAVRGEPGQKLKVGEVVLSFDGQMVSISSAHEADGQAASPAPSVATVAATAKNGAVAATVSVAVKAAPSVRHVARKLGIDLSRVSGTGPGGRILLDDLALATARPQAAREPELDVGKAGTRVKMVGLRRKIAEHMVESKRAIPHYTYIDEVDITDLVQQRAAVVEHFRQRGVKMTYLAFFVKAAVRALKDVPIVNSTFDETSNEIILHDHYHIGLAVATPGGLIVPVIRNADTRELWEIAREIDRLSNDARAGKIRREDLGGGTFTITSVGAIGGLISTPIINHPEVAILGVGKVVKRPTFDANGNFKAAEMVYLSISFDHRVVDGAVGALFGNALVKHLKDPAALLLPERL